MSDVDQTTVAVIVLCYGDRLDPLLQTLDSIENTNPNKIILVGNAVSAKVCNEMQRRAQDQADRYLLVFSDVNIGSAGGYGLGIETALASTDCTLFWLLDDDNKPDEGALKNMVACWHRQKPDKDRTAIAARRIALPDQQTASYGWPGDVPKAGSCIGFHFGNFFFRNNARRSDVPRFLPWSVYGGLLIPLILLKRIGVPKQDFFLYGDDLEWTLRITAGGGQIVPCASAVVTDLCPSWHMTGGKGSNLRRRIRDLDAFRVYYEVRNRTWIARQYFSGSRSMYFFNRACYLFVSWLLAIRYGRWQRFALIKQALNDGENGRLGQRSERFFDGK